MNELLGESLFQCDALTYAQQNCDEKGESVSFPGMGEWVQKDRLTSQFNLIVCELDLADSSTLSLWVDLYAEEILSLS